MVDGHYSDSFLVTQFNTDTLCERWRRLSPFLSFLAFVFKSCLFSVEPDGPYTVFVSSF